MKEEQIKVENQDWKDNESPMNSKSDSAEK